MRIRGTIVGSLDTHLVADTTARLDYTRGPTTWYYKANTGPHTACSSAQTGTSANLTGLTASTEYTYTAYANSTCTVEIANDTFTTLASGAAWVSNLAETADTDLSFNTASDIGEQVFTTGGTTSDRYQVKSVEVALGSCAITPRVAIFTKGANTPPRSSQVGNYLTAPTIAQNDDNIYTATGSNRIFLAGGTEYVAVIHQPATTGNCAVGITDNAGQSGTSGWSIADDYYVTSITSGKSVRLKVVASPLSLTVGSVTKAGATLTLDGHTGSWYHKQTAPTSGTCSTANTGKTANLTGLASGTGYAYKTYSDSSCSAANELLQRGFRHHRDAARQQRRANRHNRCKQLTRDERVQDRW